MNYINNLPIWDKLNKQQQEKLSNAATEHIYHKGDVIHRGDDVCTGLIFVISGQLRAFTISEDGRELTIYRLFEQDICLLSASCMMVSIQFDITIAAEKDSTLLIIPSEVYKKIMDESAPVANYTNELMASRLSEVMWLIEQIMWKSFDKRLADFLINETTIEGSNTLHITHETIGSHLGNPREVVTRMLKHFQNEGFVKLSRGVIEITDIDALRKLL